VIPHSCINPETFPLEALATRATRAESCAGRVRIRQADKAVMSIVPQPAATYRRLRDATAEGAPLLWRLLGEGTAQRICRASALTAHARQAKALRQSRAGCVQKHSHHH
jgi:hypothetical protein